MTMQHLAPAYLAAFAVIFTHGSANAESQSQINLVEVAGIPGTAAADGAEVVIRGSKRLDYTLFRLSNPARVIVDLPRADISKLPSADEPAARSACLELRLAATASM